uniref:Cation/H+ exchanger domain-containing protein n=1 Tax=Glossina palpalis gambiensis TaxID=67801 RepID=A0A1B0C1X1_9MUSC
MQPENWMTNTKCAISLQIPQNLIGTTTSCDRDNAIFTSKTKVIVDNNNCTKFDKGMVAHGVLVLDNFCPIAVCTIIANSSHFIKQILNIFSAMRCTFGGVIYFLQLRCVRLHFFTYNPTNNGSTTTVAPATNSTQNSTSAVTEPPLPDHHAVEQEHNSSLSLFFVIMLGILLIHFMLQTGFQYLPESIVVVFLSALIGLFLKVMTGENASWKGEVFSPTGFFLVLLPPIIFESQTRIDGFGRLDRKYFIPFFTRRFNSQELHECKSQMADLTNK